MQENNSQYNRYSNQVYDADELHPQKPSDNKKKKKISGDMFLFLAFLFS